MPPVPPPCSTAGGGGEGGSEGGLRVPLPSFGGVANFFAKPNDNKNYKKNYHFPH